MLARFRPTSLFLLPSRKRKGKPGKKWIRIHSVWWWFIEISVSVGRIVGKRGVLPVLVWQNMLGCWKRWWGILALPELIMSMNQTVLVLKLVPGALSGASRVGKSHSSRPNGLSVCKKKPMEVLPVGRLYLPSYPSGSYKTFVRKCSSLRRNEVKDSSLGPRAVEYLCPVLFDPKTHWEYQYNLLWVHPCANLGFPGGVWVLVFHWSRTAYYTGTHYFAICHP